MEREDLLYFLFEKVLKFMWKVDGVCIKGICVVCFVFFKILDIDFMNFVVLTVAYNAFANQRASGRNWEYGKAMKLWNWYPARKNKMK